MSKNYVVKDPDGGVDLLVYAMGSNVVVETANGRCVAKFFVGNSFTVRKDLDRALDLASRDAGTNHRETNL